MRTLLNLLLLAGLLQSCTSGKYISYTVQTQPTAPLSPSPQKIVVLSTFDPTSGRARKNIEDISSQLVNAVVERFADIINRSGTTQAVPLPGVTQLPAHGDPMRLLLDKHNASHAIVITHFDISIEQTGVEVTKTEDGKDRTAYYDICNTVNFELYDRSSMLQKKSYPMCRFHSSRQVLSGLLAFGPAYKSNQDDFNKLCQDNSTIFLKQYFPVQYHQNRPLYVGGKFKAVEAALARNDFEAAMEESRRLSQKGNGKLAAMGYYNCAVLSERNNDIATAHMLVRESMYRVELEWARLLDRDLYLLERE